jgi:hypothetical protein
MPENPKNATRQTTFEEFFDDFAKESDRAAVILGAAKLDMLLFQLLKRFLIPVTGSQDELLEGDSGLGTFSSRIHAAYRLGLVDREVTRALHLIRKIRNSVAHEISSKTLSAGSHADRISELIGPFLKYKEYDILRSRDLFPSADSSSGDFRIALTVVVGRLENAIECVEPIVDDNASTLVPDGWHRKQDTSDN